MTTGSGLSLETTPCWLCNAPSTADKVFGRDGFCRCAACGLLFQPARNSAALESARYTSDYFARYARRDMTQGSYDDVEQRRYEADRRVAFVAQHHNRDATLIEIGAASGYFVEAAARAGFDARGVEPAADTARRAAASGLPVRPGTLLDVSTEGATYDIVCAWHVLEHLPDPLSAVQQMRALMHESSHLFLETPNIESVAARLYGRDWAHLDAANHVAHYSPSTISRLLTDTGFELEDVFTVSIREYMAGSLWQSVLHLASDARTLHTAHRRHPSRHEMLRVVARAAA